jgi:hypothetical protein
LDCLGILVSTGFTRAYNTGSGKVGREKEAIRIDQPKDPENGKNCRTEGESRPFEARTG